MNNEIINIYCDESCHLENDGEKVMVIGAISCPLSVKEELFTSILTLKKKYKLIPKLDLKSKENRSFYEIKWNKVSKSLTPFYIEVIDLFFNELTLSFRCLVIPDKSVLNHSKYDQTHDTFYYKSYFNMLKVILDPNHSHNIYIDTKDTKSRERVHKTEEVLRNNLYDFSKDIIKKVQQVRSHEVELLQLADLLTGAVSYINRGLVNSEAKNILINHIKAKSGYTLVKTTLQKETKFNILIWESRN